MQNNDLIECAYGHHKTNISNFTPSGLNGPYKICRECKKEKTKKYRNQNKEKYNEKRREYNKIWMKNKRLKNKQKIIEVT